MFVKICGITRREDAEAAVDAGASAIGFVFWPKSPRFVDPYRARAIAARLLPFVTPVGLFVNQPRDYVNAVASLVRSISTQSPGSPANGWVWYGLPSGSHCRNASRKDLTALASSRAASWAIGFW